MDAGMEAVTGAVPSACEYALSRRWSKSATRIVVGGRLLAWDDRPS
jgi:hypothetical protein